jgi:spore coat polysaccharide biosynthesis protein SpsF
MGSSRLPGKILKDVGGVPMLSHVVTRTRRSQWVGQVVVATTTNTSDDAVDSFCKSHGIPVYRGDPFDVLDRYYQSARTFEAQTIIRITGDCPLIDPKEIDRVIEAFFTEEVDFAANRLPPPWHRTTPIGMDTEVVTIEALTRAWQEATAPYAREHVMPYLYEEPGRFKILLVDHEPDLGDLRLTVDTREDLILIRKIFEHFGNKNNFALEDILSVIDDHPEWLEINADVAHKSYNDVDERR